MKYNPDISVRENALCNGVSEAAVRKYIRVHGIDRRHDEKAKKNALIQKLRDEHPDWSARKIASELGIAPATVCTYFKGTAIDTVQGKWSARDAKGCLIFDANTPIDFMRMEAYDSSQVGIVAFSKGTFKYNGHSIGFGNMRKFPIDFMGHKFNCPETAYIACCYGQNNKDCIRIQKEVQASTNGLTCKRKYRYNETDRNYGRKDFHQSVWHFNLMLYLVWLKCKTHPKFCEILLAVPDDVAIIENQNGFKKVKVGDWGCKNPDAKSAYDKRLKELSLGGKSTNKMKETATIETWSKGVWVGCNHCGKILMACRTALRNNTEPYIDYQALNDAKIYLFGKLLIFRKNRSVEVNPDTQQVTQYSLYELEQVCTYNKKDVVTFKNKGKYAILSNFHPFNFTVDGVTFHSVEQYYHWRRLQGTKYQETLLSFDGRDNALRCFNYSRNIHVNKVIEKDLEKRIEFMREGLRCKLEYCDGFKDVLLNTGDRPIAELNQTSKDNDIWAVNKDTLIGSNILGKLLMELRSGISNKNG